MERVGLRGVLGKNGDAAAGGLAFQREGPKGEPARRTADCAEDRALEWTDL